jgi:hypothetical protein
LLISTYLQRKKGWANCPLLVLRLHHRFDLGLLRRLRLHLGLHPRFDLGLQRYLGRLAEELEQVVSGTTDFSGHIPPRYISTRHIFTRHILCHYRRDNHHCAECRNYYCNHKNWFRIHYIRLLLHNI